MAREGRQKVAAYTEIKHVTAEAAEAPIVGPDVPSSGEPHANWNAYQTADWPLTCGCFSTARKLSLSTYVNLSSC
jgi:hypothetical protein